MQAFRHARQPAWFEGIEGAFGHFGGLPAEVLLDNARALVERALADEKRAGDDDSAAEFSAWLSAHRTR